MTGLPALSPAATLSELYPEGTVFAPRSTAESTFWVFVDEYRLDKLSGYLVTVMGDMAVICHRNTITTDILAFYQAAGIDFTPPIAYSTADEAIEKAREYLAQGYRLAYYYPPPPEISADDNLVVPVGLYNWLNDKINLGELCDERYLSPYKLYAIDHFKSALEYLPDKPVFLKACVPGASGSGRDVCYCPDISSRIAAVEWLDSNSNGLSAMRLEEAVAVRSCWCVNVAIGLSGVRYLGAATQLFSRPGLQNGSRIDPCDQPTDEIINIAMNIGERARKLGYAGIAGFDIGAGNDNGRPFVFDLNFRQAGCTTQILLHESATRRIDCRITQSWSAVFPGPLAPVLQQMEKHVECGRFVPLRLYETTFTPGDKSIINGMIVANNQEEIESYQRVIDRDLQGLLSAHS